MELLQTIFNTYKISHEEFLYTKYKERSTFIVWRCTTRGCSGYEKIPLDFLRDQTFIQTREHNHEIVDDNYKKKLKYINKMKELIRISDLKPKHVVGRIIEGECLEIIRVLGDFENIYRMLRDYRLKFINPKPYRYNILKLNQNITKTFSNEELYQYGPENYRNLI